MRIAKANLATDAVRKHRSVGQQRGLPRNNASKKILAWLGDYSLLRIRLSFEDADLFWFQVLFRLELNALGLVIRSFWFARMELN